MRRQEITVFLALTLLCVWRAYVRAGGVGPHGEARCYLRQAVDSSMDSLLSQYHRQLWENTTSSGWNLGINRDWSKSFVDFSPPIWRRSIGIHWRRRRFRRRGMETLADRDGAFLEQQILDYMKYGLLNVEWEESGADRSSFSGVCGGGGWGSSLGGGPL